MIIVGFSGIGKSTLAGTNKFIDLESSNFNINGFKTNGWAEQYINTACHLSDQGYDVFVSCHKEVRDELKKRERHDVILIHPAPSLEELWINKLKTRYSYTNSEKDKRALDHMSKNYVKDVTDLEESNDFIRVEIVDDNYCLEAIIANIKWAIKLSESVQE